MRSNLFGYYVSESTTLHFEAYQRYFRQAGPDDSRSPPLAHLLPRVGKVEPATIIAGLLEGFATVVLLFYCVLF
jgi:hypothetical protein